MLYRKKHEIMQFLTFFSPQHTAVTPNLSSHVTEARLADRS